MEILGFGDGSKGNGRDGLSRRAKRDVQVGHFTCRLIEYKAVDVDFVLGFLGLGLCADLVCLRASFVRIFGSRGRKVIDAHYGG